MIPRILNGHSADLSAKFRSDIPVPSISSNSTLLPNAKMVASQSQIFQTEIAEVMDSHYGTLRNGIPGSVNSTITSSRFC